MEEVEKIVLVTAPTRLEELVARFNTRSQARFYVEQSGGNFDLYAQEDSAYRAAVTRSRKKLPDAIPNMLLERKYLDRYLFAANDLVVVLGRDGLVVNVAKYTDGQKIIGVNPDPARIEGTLVPFRPQKLDRVISRHIEGRSRVVAATMAEAKSGDGQRLVGLNDIFIGAGSHTSARYRLSINGESERQSSSGIIISTGVGSSGWFRSIQTGAAGVMGMQPDPFVFPWDAGYLYYSVREPWPSRDSGCEMIFGRIEEGENIIISSEMGNRGVAFSDGMEADHIDFNAPTRLKIGVASRRALLVSGR